jgi:predicted DNA-binding antitoxin AbrB/MazE fold protein
MDREVKGKFSGGVIELLENVELEEGEEITLTIKRKVDKKRAREAFLSSAGAWKDDPSMEDLKRIIYESRRSGSRTPPDP